MHYHNMDAKNVLKKKLSQKSHRHPNNQQGTDNTSRGSGIQHVRIRAGLEGGEFPSHNGCSTTCPPNQHVADE